MARALSSGLNTKSSQQYGAEPLVVVKIFWPSGTRYYTDKTYTFGVNVCEPKILSLGNIVAQRRTDTSSDVSSTSIELDDSDNTIKNSVNRDVIAGTRCIIYLMYNGLPDTDALILLEGRIANDINWTEGQRTLSVNIDTSFNIGELGFAPKAGDVANLSKDAEGQLWPIVFGSCLKVPAVQIYKSVRGKLSTFLRYNTVAVNIEGGESFPQGTPVTVRFGFGLLCTGTFTGYRFDISAYNVPYYSNVTFAARVADADYTNPAVAWLSGSQNIQGQYCYVTDGAIKLINYCYRQEGNKCWFGKPWKVNGVSTTYTMPAVDTKITETSRYVRAAWGDTYKTETYLGNINAPTSTIVVNSETQLPGFSAALFDGTIPTYVVNAVASTAIKGVYAYRTIDGRRELVAVPSSYYTKYLSTVIAGKTVTAITFNRQLSDYADQEWDDELYVTLVSTLSPNTSDVIKYLLETFTSYSVDATTFNAVKTKITNYPSHFAILKQEDTLSLISEIAYQARLAIRYDGATAKLYYLSEIPSTIETFTDDTLRSKSLNYGFTSLDDIITKYTAEWRLSYDQETPTQYIYKNNQNSFGTKEEAKDFFIYNIASLVKLSVDFWGNRLSNSWRTAKLQTFLQAIDVEPFDCIRVTTSTLSLTGIRGEVSQTSLDTVSDNIDIEVQLASKSGTHSSGTPTEDTSFFTGGVTGSEPAPADPTDGIAEEDYVITVPQENEPEKSNKYYIKIVKVPEKIVRGVAFTVGARILNEDETVRPVNATFTITLNESNDVDALTTSMITFVNGLAESNFTATGGSLNTEAVLNIIGGGDYSTGISEGIPITSEPTLTWTIDHTANERGAYFNAQITNGLANQTYVITIDSQDPNEKLYNAGGEVVSVTLDNTGAFSGIWTLRDGSFALNSVRIIATHGGEDQVSPEFLVVDAGGSSSLVVEATITGAAPGDVVMNSGTSWVSADPNDPSIETKTLAVVGKVTIGDVCYVVCRGLLCLEGLTAHTNYNLVSTAVLGAGAGRFVLRSFENDLCWVGGGTAIAKIVDIGDVDDTATPTDGTILVFSAATQKWVCGSFASTLLLDTTSSDSSISITKPASVVDFKINSVALNKIAAIATNSILANVSGSSAAPAALTAGADNTLLRRSGGTLGFGTIGDAFITDVAWGKITGAPSAFNPAAHALDGPYHTVSGKSAGQLLIATGATTFGFATMSGDATLNGSGVLTIGNGAVTNAKLANSSITINGTPVSLGGTITVDTFTNPMTTVGDLIIGGTAGAPARLPVNAGGNTQAVISKNGITTLTTLTFDLLEDVVITSAAQQDTLLFDGTSWRNYASRGRNVAMVGKIISKSAGLVYNITVYPEYPTLTPAWNVTATQLQGDSAQTLPANTWTIVCCNLKPGAYYGVNATDYNYFIQIPVWL